MEITREDLLDIHVHGTADHTESMEPEDPWPDTTTPDASPQKVVPPPPIKKKRLVIAIATMIVLNNL